MHHSPEKDGSQKDWGLGRYALGLLCGVLAVIGLYLAARLDLAVAGGVLFILSLLAGIYLLRQALDEADAKAHDHAHDDCCGGHHP